jgi:hypothetical protein
MSRIVELLKQDPLRVQIIDAVCALNLPQCYVAAGFIRNMVWDHLHGYTEPTNLNDIDVIYFKSDEAEHENAKSHQSILKRRMPNMNWQVRNQALMHTRNGDEPYRSTLDAMGFWPEKETAIAVRKIEEGEYEVVSAFGTESLWQLQVTYNPRRLLTVFEQRVTSKKWLTCWPKLQVITA